MKSTTIITLLLLQTFAFGQVIQHFENSDTRWNVAETYPDNPSFVATTTTVYGFMGDTLINGNAWRKIYVTGDSLLKNKFFNNYFTPTIQMSRPLRTLHSLQADSTFQHLLPIGHRFFRRL